jgi:SSS family solute:Na+ symporter
MSSSQTGVLAAAVLADQPEGLVRLGSIDALIVTLYFAMVIGIGFYLRRYAATGEDFFWRAGT